MFKKSLVFCCFSLCILHAQSSLDPEVINRFYDEFVCEEKNITSGVNLTPECTQGIPNPPPAPPRPPIHPNSPCNVVPSFPPVPPPLTGPSPQPSPPSPKEGYMPIVLVNNTGLPDSRVRFVVFGNIPDGCSTGSQSFVSFGPNSDPVLNPVGVTGGSLIPSGVNTPPATDYSYGFHQLPSDHIVYIPPLISGEILFSIDDPLPLNQNSASIPVPNPSLSTDPSYPYVYGQVEFSFYPSTCPQNQFGIDISAENYFGLSIQISLIQRSNNLSKTVGIFQTRHNVLYYLTQVFNSDIVQPAAKNQWNNLFINDGTKVLRVLSPGEAIFGPGGAPPTTFFDVNYFDNVPLYGYSWAENVWYGSNAYYRNHFLSISTSRPNRFIGKVMPGTNDFVFYSTITNDTYTIPWQNSTDPSQSTSASFFDVAASFPGMTYTPPGGTPQPVNPATASIDAQDITRNLSSAVISGIIPERTNKLSNSGPSNSLISLYYNPNLALPNCGFNYGPWFDLFSLSLIGTGEFMTGNVVYAYPYDDYLYSLATPPLNDVAPQVRKVDPTTYVIIQLNEYSDQ